MDDRFYTAYFPGTARVCGRSLRDFTVYHYLMMRAVDHPLTSKDGVNMPCDLLSAVAICRNKFGEPLNVKLGPKDIFWKYLMHKWPWLFAREIKKLAKWMSNHSCGPRFWTVIKGESKTRHLTGPEILTLIVPLIMKAHFSESEVMNMSMGRLRWITAQIDEFNGSERRFLWDQDLMDEEEINA